MNRFKFTLPRPVDAHLKLTAFALHSACVASAEHVSISGEKLKTMKEDNKKLGYHRD